MRAGLAALKGNNFVGQVANLPNHGCQVDNLPQPRMAGWQMPQPRMAGWQPVGNLPHASGANLRDHSHLYSLLRVTLAQPRA
jgi:hypothetical protein